MVSKATKNLLLAGGAILGIGVLMGGNKQGEDESFLAGGGGFAETSLRPASGRASGDTPGGTTNFFIEADDFSKLNSTTDDFIGEQSIAELPRETSSSGGSTGQRLVFPTGTSSANFLSKIGYQGESTMEGDVFTRTPTTSPFTPTPQKSTSLRNDGVSTAFPSKNTANQNFINKYGSV